MKNVGVLLSSPKEVGGIYQYSLSIINAVNFLKKKKKIKVTFFYSDQVWKKEIPSFSKKIYIKKNFLKRVLRIFVNFFLPRSKKNLFLKEFLFEEVEIINKSDCDVVIFPSQNITSYQIKKKSISTIHDLMHIYEPDFAEFSDKIIKIRNTHYKSICKYCTIVMVDSELGKKQLLNCFNIDKKKISVLPYIPPPYLKKKENLIDVQKKFKISKRYLFYPAQFWQHKNHYNLIKAFKILSKKYKDLNLVFCGNKKNNYDFIFDLVKKNLLDKKIIFLGRVSNKSIISLYKNSLATVYPSFFGPTNIPPLEALFLNSPVVCSDVYSMKKQLGNSALYFNPSKYLDIFKKIDLLINNRNLQKKLKIEGKKKILSYNQKHFNGLIEGILNKC
jgi:glycosyltransferase involved in cell wall biosynthesis